MKKTLLIIAVFLLAGSTAFSQVKIGGGATVGTKSGMDDNLTMKLNFGVHARALFEISDQFSVTGGFSYFLPSKITISSTDITYNYMAVNADALYNFIDDGDVKVYGIGGFNYAFIDFNLANFNGSGSGMGFEVGGGVQFGKIFFEVKYDGNAEQILGFVGFYL